MPAHMHGLLAVLTGLAGAEWSSDWVGCVRAVLEDPRTRIDTVSLLCSAYYCAGPALQTQLPMLVARLDSAMDLMDRSAGLAYVVTTSSASSVQRLLHAQKASAARSAFVLSWPGASLDEEAMRQIFELCWEIGILQVVIVDLQPGSSNHSVDVYGYNPFRWDNCFDTSPVRVATWDASGGMSGEVFTPVQDLHGCPLVVLVQETPPYWLLDEGDQGEVLRGEWAPVVQALEQGLNATFQIRPMKHHHWIRNNTWDIAVSWFSSSVQLSHLGQFTETFRSACYSICVPLREQRRRAWANMIRAVDQSVGVCVLMSAVLAALVFGTITRTNRSFIRNAWMLVFVHHSPIHRLATSTATRLLLAHWMVFHLVFTIALQAAEKSVRAAPITEQSIRTVTDLVQADVWLEGRSTFIPNIEGMFAEHAGGTRYFQTRVASYTSSEFDANHVRKDVAYMCGKIERQVLAQARRLSQDIIHRVLEDKCLISLPERLTLLPKASPYSHIVSRVTAALSESGIMAKIIEAGDHNTEATFVHTKKYSDRKTPLVLMELRHAWAVIVTGWIVSSAALAAEIFFFAMAVLVKKSKQFLTH